MSDNYSRWFCKELIIKLSLAYIFRKMLIIYQKFKAYSCEIIISWTFHLLLISSSKHFFGLISHYIKEILYVNKYHKWWNKNRGIYIFHLSQMLKNPAVLMQSYNTLSTFFNFIQFHHGIITHFIFHYNSMVSWTHFF